MDRCLAGFLAVSENLDRLAKANLKHIHTRILLTLLTFLPYQF